MKKLIGVAILYATILSLSGQSSPGIDSLLAAIEENQRTNCIGFCGTSCRQIEWTLKLELCKQYFKDGYPEEGLTRASEFVSVSSTIQNQGRFEEVFLDLLFQYYTSSELKDLVENPDFYYHYDNFLLELAENEAGVSDGITTLIPVSEVFVKLGDIMILIVKDEYDNTGTHYSYQTLESNEESRIAFENSLEEIWRSSGLFDEINFRLTE